MLTLKHCNFLPLDDHFRILALFQVGQLKLADEGAEENVEHVDRTLDQQAMGELVEQGRSGLARQERAVFVQRRGGRDRRRLVAGHDHRLDGLPVVQKTLQSSAAEPGGKTPK